MDICKSIDGEVVVVAGGGRAYLQESEIEAAIRKLQRILEGDDASS